MITSRESARTWMTLRAEVGHRFEPGDQRAVFGNVVGGHADAFADLGDERRRLGGRVPHDRADRCRPGVPAGSTVAIEEQLLDLAVFAREGKARLRHGTRMAPQLSQYATVAPSDLRICSASVDGIDRWHAVHDVPTSRAAPAPLFCARRRW